MVLGKSASTPDIRIPFLPGNTVRTVGGGRHHRAQNLCYKFGTACDKLQGPPMDEDSLQTLVTSMQRSQSTPALRMTTEEKAELKETERINYRPAQQPAWLKHDKQVLRYYAYFQEAVVESPTENYRVRNCVFTFYLEDGTMQIVETKVANSGIWPQGPMLTRHKVPYPGVEGRVYTPEDLVVGTSVMVYGRNYRLIGCDDFTKWFSQNAGIEQGPEESAPLDSFLQNQVHVSENVTVKTGFPRDVMEGKEFNELKLGGGRRNFKMKQFLENDRKVLRFYAYWDDETRYGARMYFKVHYFLSDDTVEILNQYSRNSGRWQNPVFFTRCRLVLDPEFKISPGMVDESQERCLRPDDIRIGGTIPVFGRLFTIYEADESTQKFYEQFLGLDMTKIEIPAEDKIHFKLQFPPHSTGLGSEEDSLGSVLALRPKPPAQDMVKRMTMSDVVLRYEAKPENGVPEDVNRTFVIGVFMRDDEVGVWEKMVRNSGFWSGKFSAKSRKINPENGERFKPSDFYVGARVIISSMPFFVTRADEFALKFMEKDAATYPQSSMDLIAKKLAGLEEASPNVPGQTSMAPEDFRDHCRSAVGALISDQELVTVLRACGTDEASIQMEQVYIQIRGG